MILMYDKLQAQSPKEEYVNKIKVLNEELKELCKPFFPSKWVKSELEKMDEIVKKYL
jgi:hypothetical protein